MSELSWRVRGPGFSRRCAIPRERRRLIAISAEPPMRSTAPQRSCFKTVIWRAIPRDSMTRTPRRWKPFEPPNVAAVSWVRIAHRSEERRVGKEYQALSAPQQYEKILTLD